MSKGISTGGAMVRLTLALKAMRELGPRQLGLYLLYQLGLHSGYFQRLTKDAGGGAGDRVSSLAFNRILSLPARSELTGTLGDQGLAWLLAEANEIVSGSIRLFGGEPTPLHLTFSEPLVHWTVYARQGMRAGDQGSQTGDIKYLWEPGRFCWAYTLGRAYYLSADERYADTFWRYAETFLDANPPYLGPHWVSSQEVALRLVAFLFALHVFAASPHTTPDRAGRLAGAVAEHAQRIPPTMVYAQAQNNNHLLTEAAGLYSAGLALPGHPSAQRWRKLGWHWFHRGVRSQFADDGTYMQHSANYHRVALQVALWVYSLATGQGQKFPEESSERLVAGTRWLLALLDNQSGRLPNLGPNDGAYILPLTVCPFDDYRPVLQAAGTTFLGTPPIDSGLWDELLLWIGNQELGGGTRGRENEAAISQDLQIREQYSECPHVLRPKGNDSWAYLRVARFTDRPGHADQLHLDLWWRGLNVAKDAGTYLYNAPLPWNNALVCTEVHNTVTVNGRDQMTRAGKFLYLDWAQAQLRSCELAGDGDRGRIVAQHNGYYRQGLIHRRSVAASATGNWLVEDTLLPTRTSPATRQVSFQAALHWLLPDWPWEFASANGGERFVIRLRSPQGWMKLDLSVGEGSVLRHLPKVQIVRAGDLVYGSGPVSPIWGWSSPTYGVKVPALSLRLIVEGHPPLKLGSVWSFP